MVVESLDKQSCGLDINAICKTPSHHLMNNSGKLVGEAYLLNLISNALYTRRPALGGLWLLEERPSSKSYTTIHFLPSDFLSVESRMLSVTSPSSLLMSDRRHSPKSAAIHALGWNGAMQVEGVPRNTNGYRHLAQDPRLKSYLEVFRRREAV